MVDFVKSGSEASILNVLLKNCQLLSNLYPQVLDKHAKELLTHVGARLKKKDLSQEAKSTLFAILQVLVFTTSKATCKAINNDLFGLFEKARIGKESLAAIFMVQSLFQAISKHELAEFDGKVQSATDFLVESCSNKLELKVKKAILDAFGPLISLRKAIGPARLLKILEIVQGSFSLEALHLSCISTLEYFGHNKTQEISPELNKAINSILEKILELFVSKNKIYQVGIVKVLEALHQDQGISVASPTQQSILKSFSTVIEKCDLGTSKTIATFLLNHQDSYKKYPTDIEKVVQLMRSQLSSSTPDDDYLKVLVRLHKDFTPPEEFARSVSKIFDSIKNDPHSEVETSSLFLFFLFKALPDVQQILAEIVDDVVSRRSKNFCLSLSLLGHLGYIKNLSKSPMLVEVLIKNIGSTESIVKSYAVRALTGIGIFDINSVKQVFDSQLTNSVETRMFFFASVHALFEYLPDTVSKESINSFLDYLGKFVETVEQAERPELFKAYGKVLKKDPSRINSLFKEFKTRTGAGSIYKLLGASVCKQIFDSSYLCLGNYPVVSELLLDCLNSSDPDIETAAFVSLDAIHCIDPKSVNDLLNMQVCNLMARKMVSDETLVEKIEMGLFSHKIDNGLKLRKACFNFLLRLCQQPMFNINPFLGAVVKGLGDENEDVRYQATRVVSEGIVANGQVFLLMESSQELGVSLEKAFKSFKPKLAMIVQEKGGNYQSVKSLVALIQELAKTTEFGSNPQIKALESEILANVSLKDLTAK